MTDNESDSNDQIEIHANLKEVSVRAGGGWKKHLGPWLGPIILVMVFGVSAAMIIVAVAMVR